MGSKANVLCIQNIGFETLGTLEKMLISDGYSIDIIEAWHERITSKLSDYSAAIVLGGPMAVYDQLDQIQSEQELVSRCIEQRIPVLGICLGSQIIAQAIGGRVFKGPKKEIGWGKVALTPKSRISLFRGLGQSITVFHWHGDTYELPRGAGVLAFSENYIQGFQFKSAVGIQFHLEVNMEMIKRWSTEYSNEVVSEGIIERDLYRPKLTSQLSATCRRFYLNFMDFVKDRETRR